MDDTEPVHRLAAVLLLLLLLLAAAAGGVTAGGAGAPPANGLPSYTEGYRAWPKLNARPVTGGSAAHAGVKNVYRSKPRAGKLFPNGTVIVKTIVQPGATGLPGQVAVMRKVRGRWQWVEYVKSGSRYGVLAQGGTCTSCHIQAKASDWVFTGR